LPAGETPRDRAVEITSPQNESDLGSTVGDFLDKQDVEGLFEWVKLELLKWDYNTLGWVLDEIARKASESDDRRSAAIAALTLLNDLRYPTGNKRRSSTLELIRDALNKIFRECPPIDSDAQARHRFMDIQSRDKLRAPREGEQTLVFDATGFTPEGPDCHSHVLVEAYGLGWKRFIVYGLKGERFSGCGFGPGTEGVVIDLYDSSGDYIASGIDGMEMFIHGHAQDQLAQIIKAGKLVVYGDVGQTFMYGAKGGSVYIMGNAAGRPLINAAGKPRVVINGTCLDFLAESFMAGDALNGGGFVVLNAVEFDDDGNVKEMPAPYPGSNLFSLASGGAIYVRDPHRRIVDEQLNGGELVPMSNEDWELILPYLEENERLFGISIEEHLLNAGGRCRPPEDIYRKVRPVKLAVLTEIEDSD
jgi:glutamate synthase domain-containing protein 3